MQALLISCLISKAQHPHSGLALAPFPYSLSVPNAIASTRASPGHHRCHSACGRDNSWREGRPEWAAGHVKTLDLHPKGDEKH